MALSALVFAALQLLLRAHCSDCFAGFWETNYNETITVCVFDQPRGVLLGRTHWPDTPFNEDSAALQGAVHAGSAGGAAGVDRESVFTGVGATITGGAYTFSMQIKNTSAVAPNPNASDESMQAVGSFNFLDKEEQGVWLWRYVRAASGEECDLVTQVRATPDLV